MARVTEHGSIMLGDEPEDMPFFQLLQWKFALKLQYDTGLGHSRGSVPKFVAQKFGMKYRTRKDIPALIEECERRLNALEDSRRERRANEAINNIPDGDWHKA